MGEVPVKEAHEESLSGMSNAWRWARAERKFIITIAVMTVAVVCLFSALLNGTNLRSATILADGRTIEVVTATSTVAELLEEQGVQLGEYDEISLPLEAQLIHGTAVEIERAFPVNIEVDGEMKVVYTTGAKVTELLDQAGVRLGTLDKIEPSITSTLTAASDVKITRVQKVFELTEHALPFETVTQEDKSLLRGKEHVVQPGQEGLLVKKIEKVYEDGVLVSEQVVAREVEQESQSRVVAIGTKVEPKQVTNAVSVLSAESTEVTLNGMTFGVKGVLNNVTLTAYSADFASTGKNKGDPGYGITASGTKVSEGRTIAVDEDVIPMGWWVYIDGIGFRRAEDKGSAIKGKKIDIYFDSENHAKKFGSKKGYTVYIIGPKKPAINDI